MLSMPTYMGDEPATIVHEIFRAAWSKAETSADLIDAITAIGGRLVHLKHKSRIYLAVQVPGHIIPIKAERLGIPTTAIQAFLEGISLPIVGVP